MGINSVVDVEDGIIVTGQVRSIYAQTFVGDAGQVTSYWEGIRINMWAHASAVINQLSALHINNYVEVQPTGHYHFLDLRENAPVTVDVGIYMGIGSAADMTNLFKLPSNKTAWSATNHATGGIAGRIAVEVSGVQRYIALYT